MMAESGEPTPSRSRSQDPAPRYPRNASGLTYGSALQATSPANEPDLIQAIATNGKTGYVRRADITPPEPTNPAEAAARSSAEQGPKTVPVYQQDGISIIGEFVLAAPSGGRSASL